MVDNDRHSSAAAIAGAYGGLLSLRYVVEPHRGLSQVRNRAVAESRGSFIAFIDDDEIAAPDWLATMDRVQALTDAAAVFGPVHVQLEPCIPPEIRDCRLFRPHVAEACADSHGGTPEREMPISIVRSFRVTGRHFGIRSISPAERMSIFSFVWQSSVQSLLRRAKRRSHRNSGKITLRPRLAASPQLS